MSPGLAVPTLSNLNRPRLQLLDQLLGQGSEDGWWSGFGNGVRDSSDKPSRDGQRNGKGSSNSSGRDVRPIKLDGNGEGRKDQNVPDGASKKGEAQSLWHMMKWYYLRAFWLPIMMPI